MQFNFDLDVFLDWTDVAMVDDCNLFYVTYFIK